MDRQRQSVSSKPKSSLKNKQNQSDTVYLMQNQNAILRMKNAELRQKVNELKLELTEHNDRLIIGERDVEDLKTSIKSEAFIEDLQLQTQKKMALDKIALMRGNEDILKRKIDEVRAATVFQQSKIGGIIQNKKVLDKKIITMRTQNEGTKVILRNLEEQNEKLRAQNEQLVAKRKQYQPLQKDISLEIQERIRMIKNKQSIINQSRKIQGFKIVNSVLQIIFTFKLKEAFILIQKSAFNRKIAQKRIFKLSVIRKNYVNFIKQKVLQCFKSSFRPLQQQQKCKRIIKQMQTNRIKNKIWRIWRAAAIKQEYSLIKKFEFQNLLQTLFNSLTKTKIYSAFSMLKYYQNNTIKQKGIRSMSQVINSAISRSLNSFFSSFISAQNAFKIDLQLQASAKQQSELLILSLYFSSWAMIYKCHKVSNKNIKFRYFREFKKLLKLKNQRKLGQMLTIANEKIKNINTSSEIFAQMNKEAMNSKIESLEQQKSTTLAKVDKINNETLELQNQKKDLYRQLSLLRIAIYLKSKVQKAFNSWRRSNLQTKVLKYLSSLILSKQKSDINFAYSRIQKKRFQMLKKSIADKIESCQFSYNYLLEENGHIKKVLDTKTHQLQKSKFVKILKRLIRDQKQTKHKYFYKFLKNGYRCWKVKKVLQKIDFLIQKKIKLIFMFLVRENYIQKVTQAKVEYIVQRKETIIERGYYKRAFEGFKREVTVNKRLKRAMGGIFDRNIQLDFYVAFGKIKNQQTLYNRNQLLDELEDNRKQIKVNNEETEQIENTIEMLTERLKNKEATFRERKVLSLYIFFSKNVKNNVSTYLNRWRTKIQRQNRVKRFAILLERKTRILLKNKFILGLKRSEGDSIVTELKDKLNRYQADFDKASSQFQNFSAGIQKQSQKMKQQNEFHQTESKALQNQTDRMVEIKIKGFLHAWGKKMTGFIFKEWRIQTNDFIHRWTAIFKMLKFAARRQTFRVFSMEMKEEVFRARIKGNLNTAYTKKYRYNAGLAFRIWRMVNLNKKLKEEQARLAQQTKGFKTIETNFNNAVKRHIGFVDFRKNDRILRKIVNFIRQYTFMKIENNKRKQKLQKWLFTGYSVDFIKILKRNAIKPRQHKKKIQKYNINLSNRLKQFCFSYIATVVRKKNSIKRLFFNKFVFYQMMKLNEEFFYKTKNYHRFLEVKNKSRATFCIQKVIETFQKKRKDILNFNFRRWRRNQYEMAIGIALMKRLTRRSMNFKVRDLFFAWKLQKQARLVKHTHEEQGEIKKRKIQIRRLEKYLEDFKKSKGLLLQNQEGHLVVSPRFQQKKEQQVKKDNNLRYKFISRIILSMNNYSAPIKAWNNIDLYLKIREKYRKTALIIRNKLRKPQLYSAFKIWQNAAQEFKKMFQVMERKDIIKILNRQKDKMEMQYSKKLSIQEHMQEQMRKYKALSYQDERKEKLCAQIFMRCARKVKLYAFMAWRQNAAASKDHQLKHLQDKGSYRLSEMDAEVEQLQRTEAQLRQSNIKLEQAVAEALEIAEMVKRISEQRDILSKLIKERQLTCQSLQQENQQLNAKLHLAQKEAMNLLMLSGQQL